MEDTEREGIVSKENELREYMIGKRDIAEENLNTPEWKGVMVSLSLDVLTSGLQMHSIVETLLALGWLMGKFNDDPEFQGIIKDFPAGDDVRQFWNERLDEVIAERQMEKAKNPLLREGEEE